jgi:hypothetical protein
MICFPMLGRHGFLGNQMFQYASLAGIAAWSNKDYQIPFFGHNLHCFNIDFTKNSYVDTPQVQFLYQQNESDYAIDEDLRSVPGQTAIHGYFQNIGYFKHIEAKIREDFEFSDEIRTKSRLELNSLLKSGETAVCVHVRRGDYLSIPDVLPVCSDDYYASAFKEIKRRVDNPRFVVFSNDLPWCRDHFQSDEFSFFETENSHIDMCAISMCDHHVIANSSFSWWGAWLSKSEGKIVIRPKIWFGPRGPKKFEGMFPNEWISL